MRLKCTFDDEAGKHEQSGKRTQKAAFNACVKGLLYVSFTLACCFDEITHFIKHMA